MVQLLSLPPFSYHCWPVKGDDTSRSSHALDMQQFNSVLHLSQRGTIFFVFFLLYLNR